MPMAMLIRYFGIFNICWIHDDVIEWKHFQRYWPFVRGIHWSPANSKHKGKWRGTLMLSLICAWLNSWVNNREAGDLRRHRAHYHVSVMTCQERTGNHSSDETGTFPGNQYSTTAGDALPPCSSSPVMVLTSQENRACSCVSRPKTSPTCHTNVAK